MLPTHNPLLRYSAAFPALLLFLLLLSEPPPASSTPASCLTGHTYWDSIQESCVPCTRCLTPEIVLIPCQPHMDVRCGPLSALGIDWSWMRTTQSKNQKRLRAQYQRSSVAPSLQPVTSPPQRPGLTRKVPRPRTPEGGGRVPETAARVMESNDPPPRVPAEGVVLPSAREEEEAWTWRHWLVAGVAMTIACAAILALSPLAVRRMRGWERCSSSFRRKPRRPESRKRKFNKIVKNDPGAAKGKGGFSEGGHGFYSANQHILLMEEILDRKKAAAWGSLRDESTNLYVEDTPVKVVAPSSSVTVATMTPGMVPSVKVEVQGDSIHRNLAKNCLRLGCASRTMLTGRSSAV